MSKKNITRLVVILLLIAVFFIASRESAMVINGDSIKFSGMYGTTLNTEDIDSVELREVLPAVQRRNNGIGFMGLQKGHFTLAEFGKARLLLHSKSGPYIVIQAKEQVVIINYRDSQQTRTEYERVAAALD